MFAGNPNTSQPDSLAALVDFLKRLDGATLTITATLRLAGGSAPVEAPADPAPPPAFKIPGS